MTLSVTMAKLLATQEEVDGRNQEIEQDIEAAIVEESEARVEYEDAHAEALIEFRNDRQDISKARAHLACKDQYKRLNFAEARRRFWEKEQKLMVEKQRSITAACYAYNSELKRDL